MNISEQKSKIAKNIFEKVDEYKDWSSKLEKIKIEYNNLNESLNKERDEYFKLDKGYSDYEKFINEKKEVLNFDIDSLVYQKSDLEDKIVSLGNELLDNIAHFDLETDKLTQQNARLDSINLQKKQEIDELANIKTRINKEIEDVRGKNQYLLATYGNLLKKIAESEAKIVDMESFIADIRKREQDIVLRETRVFEKEKKLKQK